MYSVVAEGVESGAESSGSELFSILPGETLSYNRFPGIHPSVHPTLFRSAPDTTESSYQII